MASRFVPPEHADPLLHVKGDNLLDGWKSIASYLGRTVRTVQRWELEEALPVYRHDHTSLSTVYAYRPEIDQWRAARTRQRLTAEGAAEPSIAHQKALKGRYYWEKRTVPHLFTALREYKALLDEDPTSAAAYAGLAKTYFAFAGNEFAEPCDAYPKARAAAQEAVRLDPRPVEAHTVLAVVEAFFDGHWQQGQSRIVDALVLDPSCALAHYWGGMIAMNVGEFDRAIAGITAAKDRLPLSAIVTANVGRPLLCTGHFKEAKRWFKEALTIDPGFWIAHGLLAIACDALGEFEEAMHWLNTADAGDQTHPMLRSVLAQVHAHAGEHSRARAVLDDLLDPGGPYVSPVRVAQVCVALGDPDAAFAHLEQARTRRALRNNTYLPFDYAFTPVRDDPRFAVCLAHYWNRS